MSFSRKTRSSDRSGRRGQSRALACERLEDRLLLDAGDWDVTQLTSDGYYDVWPRVSGSYVSWESDRESGWTLSYYDGTTVTQPAQDVLYHEMSEGNAVWERDGDIFLYDGSAVTQLTDDGNNGWPQVSGSNVAWHREYGESTSEILLYDGADVTQLIDGGDHYNPQVSGSNVVWTCDVGASDSEIFFYDGSTVTQLTDGGSNRFPDVSGSNVVWCRFYSDTLDDTQIFFYDGSSVTQLTDAGYNYDPQVSGSNVVWCRSYTDTVDGGLFFYDGTSITQLSDDGDIREPQISGSNVVWHADDGNDTEIFFYDGNSVTQLTDNDYWDTWPRISGSQVVWEGQLGDSSDSGEIFLAKPAEPTSSIVPGFLGTGICDNQGDVFAIDVDFDDVSNSDVEYLGRLSAPTGYEDLTVRDIAYTFSGDTFYGVGDDVAAYGPYTPAGWPSLLGIAAVDVVTPSPSGEIPFGIVGALLNPEQMQPGLPGDPAQPLPVWANALEMNPANGKLYAAGAHMEVGLPPTSNHYAIYEVDVDSASGYMVPTTPIVDLGSYRSTGDIAFDDLGNLYLTTDDATLLEIDVLSATPAIVGEVVTDTGYGDFDGLTRGFAGGVFYGFRHDGTVYAFDVPGNDSTQVGSEALWHAELDDLYGATVALMEPVAVSAPIDGRELLDQQPTLGQLWYEFQADNDGDLSVDLTAGGTLMTLYGYDAVGDEWVELDSDAMEVGISDAEAGVTYMLHVEELTGEADFRFHNGGAVDPPPRITIIDELPEYVGVVGEDRVNSLTVHFSEEMNQGTVEDPANWELLEAGPDGAFDSGDDVEYAFSSLTYYAGEAKATLDIDGGPLPIGLYRLTAEGDASLQDAAGNPLDGNSDGTGGDDYVTEFVASIGFGVAGDSLSDEYFEESYDYAQNWVESLAQFTVYVGEYREDPATWPDVRGEGYQYNWAVAGATSATLLSGGQHTGLAQQVNDGLVTHAVLAIGQNDFFPLGAAYGAIYLGTWDQGDIDAYNDGVAQNIDTALATLTATDVKLVVSNVIDYGVAPSVRAGAPDVAGRQRVADAIGELNDRIEVLAASYHIPLVDSFGLTKTYLGEHGAEVPFQWVGGVQITNTAGADPHNGFVADGLHPHTVLQASFANTFVEALNIGYGTQIDQFTDEEMLTLAGLGAEYDEFGQSLEGDYADYVILPPTAPGDVLLLEDGAHTIDRLDPETGARTAVAWLGPDVEAWSYCGSVAGAPNGNLFFLGSQASTGFEGYFMYDAETGDVEYLGVEDAMLGTGANGDVLLLEDGSHTIDRLDPETGARRLVAFLESDVEAWSYCGSVAGAPNGNLFFSGSQASTGSVGYFMSPYADTGDVEFLGIEDAMLGAGPNGDVLLLEDGAHTIDRLDPETGARTPVASLGPDVEAWSYCGSVAGAPNGNFFFLGSQASTGFEGYFMYDADTGGVEYLGIDAAMLGLVAPLPVGRIGDVVWDDLNADGIQQAGEPGVENVQVDLFDAGPDGLYGGSGDDLWIGTDTTDGNGLYSFDSLLDGRYYLEFSNLPAGYGFTLQDVGADDALDSDVYQAGFLAGFTDVLGLGYRATDDTCDAGIVNAFSSPTVIPDPVEFEVLEDQVPDAYGQLRYQFTSSREGMVSARVDYAGDCMLALYDSDQNLLDLDTSALHQVDYSEAYAGDVFYLHVAGIASPTDVVIANLLEYDTGTGSVTVHGTDGPDEFTGVYQAAPNPHEMWINGFYYDSDWFFFELNEIAFDGGGGDDSAVISGSDQSDEGVVGPYSATMYANGNAAAYDVKLEVSNTESIDVDGAGGADTGTLNGGAGVESLDLWPGYCEWEGNPFTHIVRNVEILTANGADDDDTAAMRDSAGADAFTADPDSATLSGPGYTHTVNNFRWVYAFASDDGETDTATLDDLPGSKDSFRSWSTEAKMIGTGFFNRAKGFDEVVGRASDASDDAELNDSSGADSLEAYADRATMTYPDGKTVEAEGFRHVYASASDDGETDTAYLYDTTADLGTAYPAWFQAEADASKMYYGTLFFNRARGFDEVIATATHGNNKGRMYDSLGADTFEAYADRATMSYAGGPTVRANGIRWLFAYGSDDGATDTAYLYDTTADLGTDYATWLKAYHGMGKMYEVSTFYNRVDDFDEVIASAVGGDDKTKLFDSPGPDTFDGYADRSTMSYADGTVVRADGFRWLFAFASDDGETDTARLYDTTADLGTSYATWLKGFNDLSKMYDVSTFYNRVDDFNEVIASAVGSNDTAKLFDSSGADALEAYADQATMSYPDGTTVQADDFRWVLGYGSDDGQVDTAQLYDTTADLGTSCATWFKAGNGFSRFYEDTVFYVQAQQFDRVSATATGSDDTAKLYDSALDDVYWSRPDHSRMEYADGTYTEALDFRYVLSYSRDGADKATLYDATAGGTSYAARFAGYATWSKLYHGAFYSRTEGFAELRASLAGGDDLAWLYDDPARVDHLLVTFPGDVDHTAAKAKLWTDHRAIYIDDFHTLTATTSENFVDDKDIDPAYEDDVILDGNWAEAP